MGSFSQMKRNSATKEVLLVLAMRADVLRASHTDVSTPLPKGFDKVVV
jgi:hypothetical protein